MRTINSFAILTALVLLEQSASRPAFAGEEGLALAIVYDTSGSMKEPVRDQNGRPTPKYLIANRSLITVSRRIQDYSTNNASGTPRRIDAALFVFKGSGAQEAIPLGPFSQQSLESWARHFSKPGGNTPLGNALSAAAQCVLNSPLSRKHILVITDGINTVGPQPAQVLPRLKASAEQKGAAFSVHFVAFDVDAKRFDSVKKLGATVVGAADEKQLNAQLDFILQHKILLEDEEPAKTN